MAVKRVVANITADRVAAANAFYADVLGMTVAMDLAGSSPLRRRGRRRRRSASPRKAGLGPWFPTFRSKWTISTAVYRRAAAGGFAIEYGPVSEPWGVRRFYCPMPVWPAGQYSLRTRHDRPQKPRRQ